MLNFCQWTVSNKQPSSQNIQSVSQVVLNSLSIHGRMSLILMHLTTGYTKTAVYSYSCDEGYCDLLEPIVFNITIIIIPCPPGFVHLKEPEECKCHPTLISLSIECHSFNRIVDFLWKGAVWVTLKIGNK